MKITFLLPFFGLSGGVKIILEYAEELSRRGHTVNIFYPTIFPFPGKNLSQKIYRVAYSVKNFLGWVGVPWTITARPKRVWRLTAKNIPDADVVVATAWPTAFSVHMLPESKGKKFYFIQHYESWDGHIEKVDASWKLPLHRIVIATWLQNLGREKFGVESDVIFDGIRFEDFDFPQKEFRRPVKQIGMLVHPAAWKGTKEGLEALTRVHEAYPDIDIQLYGRFKDPRVPAWASQRVNLGTEELREYFGSLDIYVHPARNEGWGLPILEAMASKTAVAITDCLGPRDFARHEENALVSEVGDVSALANNILRLIQEPLLFEKLTRGAFDTAKRLTVARAVTELEKIFS